VPLAYQRGADLSADVVCAWTALKQSMLGVVAFDRQKRAHVLLRQGDHSAAGRLFVLRCPAEGASQRLVALQEPTGKPLVGTSRFLTVDPEGSRYWLALPTVSARGEEPFGIDIVLCAAQGTVLQRWHVEDWESAINTLRLDGERTVVMTTDDHAWRVTQGRPSVERTLHWTLNDVPGDNGTAAFWGESGDANCLTEVGQGSGGNGAMPRFSWPKGSPACWPFWYDRRAGLFCLGPVRTAGAGDLRSAKNVYRVSARGGLRLLFRTDTVAKPVLGEIRTGWALCADSHGSVWFDAVPLTGRQTEYMIVKVTPERRWRAWMRWMRRQPVSALTRANGG
jgi:hypothetical protein